MSVIAIEKDQIDRVGIVAIIDDKPVGNDRKIPVQPVNQLPLARGEHRAKRHMFAHSRMPVDEPRRIGQAIRALRSPQRGQWHGAAGCAQIPAIHRNRDAAPKRI
ncbi:hypothetical protein [Sphingopyxis sp. MWB1]|uniref:hypothetical protein n=1 Tax=Sphingopyxis sp. MWB1 TaxID=1537715 RepID=UPI0009DF1CAC|nr:hypothetical protein [Sphingopyxis sp. MWB1]